MQQPLNWLQKKRRQWQVADLLCLKVINSSLNVWQPSTCQVQLYKNVFMSIKQCTVHLHIKRQANTTLTHKQITAIQFYFKNTHRQTAVSVTHRVNMYVDKQSSLL